MTIYTDYYQNRGTEIKVGVPYIVCELRNTVSGAKWYTLNPDISKGVPGNSDPSVRRYHGWRGTTGNISKYALGVRNVVSLTRFQNGNARVTLSEDLHPDYD